MRGPLISTAPRGGAVQAWADAAHAGAGVRDMQAQLFTPSLHRQRWSFEGRPASALSRVLHLSAGRGVLFHADGQSTLHPTDVVWLPAGDAREIRLDPGSTGVSVGVSDGLLSAAIGDRAEVAALRQVASRRIALTAVEGQARDEIVRSLLAMEAEGRGGLGAEGGGGAMGGIGGLRPYLAAHLTIVLVGLWRLSSRGADLPAMAGPGAQRVLRFRHLVESQFRAHWSVAQYARELGVSPDGLHDLCTRALGRSPLALVHQRLIREACSLLAGTELSVERLSTELGFASASHFSRFFKRWMGKGPRDWRQQVRRQAATGLPRVPLSYADWP